MCMYQIGEKYFDYSEEKILCKFDNFCYFGVCLRNEARRQFLFAKCMRFLQTDHVSALLVKLGW